jgi:hypothetical protein
MMFILSYQRFICTSFLSVPYSSILRLDLPRCLDPLQSLDPLQYQAIAHTPDFAKTTARVHRLKAL